eukprot:CAMPEP_0171043214 /NCGR_PEP_ID=MMETSP0736-20130129/46862_1 /TAXON_ID=186038 /ORGANISM="Fragilariopsis kerguelensis, Strain L26-C5" /LENGTH=95 /DNA_ID=CAMNT_0011492133 /DNA_START=2480 /DNA_END=2764 /DNA_ORIENTATION=-
MAKASMTKIHDGTRELCWWHHSAPVSYSWFEVDHSLLHRRETSLSHTRPHLVGHDNLGIATTGNISSLATPLNIPARNSSSAVSCMVGADRSKAR